MQRFYALFGLIFFLASIDVLNAQGNSDKTDSTLIYKKIELFSKKSKLTKLLYPLLFNPVKGVPPKTKSIKKAYKKLIIKPYSAYEGKIIRNINIQTLDPFVKSISDTTVSKQNWLTKTGNKAHIKSLHLTIRNLLLIREGQVFDSLLVKESERLIRSNSYVRDVLFTVVQTSKKSDSVDIFIREMDKWSIIPKIGASNTKVSINVVDKNIFGLGHEIQLGYNWNHALGEYAYKANYYISNIRNTYVNATFHFDSDENRSYIRNISVDRPFYSPFARWAAGMNFAQNYRTDSILLTDALFYQQSYKFNTQDYWAGFAVQLFKGNTEDDRTTNLIPTLRYLRIRYLDQPVDSLDPINLYSNEDLYLAGLGVSTRKYVQDKYIFNYGITEDVPVGRVISFIGGYQIKNHQIRKYIGARFTLGNYYSWGYLSSGYEYGTFFSGSKTEQGIVSASVNYFTGLLESGKWKFRLFIKPSITLGINRNSNDSLTIKDGFGLDGFNSSGLSGTRRLLLTLQTQSYAPWNVIGFRFGPYLIYSAGMLGDSNNGFRKSRLYSQIGFGVLMKNENLVFNTFQLSVAFYPLIPGIGSGIFKMNAFKTTDFGFKDFVIGKPGTVTFE